LLEKAEVGSRTKAHEAMPAEEHLLIISMAAMSLITAIYYCRTRAKWYGRFQCPKCHQAGNLELAPASITRPRPSLAALFIGGVIVTILLQHAHETRFHCAGCSTDFNRRTWGAWLAIAWLVVIALNTLAAFLLGHPSP